jgi:lipopolysaccharide export system permease protein
VILRRYVSIEIALTAGAIFLVLLVIVLSRNIVIFLGAAAAGKLLISAVAELTGLNILTMLGFLVPLSLFMGTLIAFGRLARDNELIAMKVAGVGQSQLKQYVIRLGLVFAVLMSIVSLLVAPYAEKTIREKQATAEQESDVLSITPGVFKELGEGERLLFVRQISKTTQRMEDVFLQDRSRSDGTIGVLTADSATIDSDPSGNRYAIFEDGHRYEGIVGHGDYVLTKYERLGIRLDIGNKDHAIGSSRAVPTLQLLGSKDLAYAAELQWRLSIPVATLLLAVFAQTLIEVMGRMRRDVRYSALVVAILVYFTYSNMLSIARTLVRTKQIHPFPGLWVVHLMFIAIILLIQYQARWRRFLSQWRRRA